MNDILKKLMGGDRRSICRADEVVAEVLEEPSLFDPLFQGLYSDDPLVRMRAADTVEKISVERPGYLQPYKEALLGEIARIEQQEVRWHVALMMPRLELTAGERLVALGILTGYLENESRIVKSFSMQGMADLASQDGALRPVVMPILEELSETGSPAMRSRGRRLLKELQSEA